MRILVLGHSDSGGDLLDNPAQAWPFLLEKNLQRTLGRDVVLEHLKLEPLRRNALSVVEAAVTDNDPDLVMLHLNPYGFAIRVVSLRIRERFGSRAARLYSRCERRFTALTNTGRVRTRINRLARRGARRLVGASALASYEVVVEAYAEVFRQLARHEHIQVMVMGGSRLSRELQAANPGMLARIEQFALAMQAEAESHHFLWFDTETSVAGDDRHELFMADGIHRTAGAHRRLADMLLPLVREMAETTAPA